MAYYPGVDDPGTYGSEAIHNLACDVPLDDGTNALCSFEGDVTVYFGDTSTGQWECPSCGITHTVAESELYDEYGIDPDAAYDSWVDYQMEADELRAA